MEAGDVYNVLEHNHSELASLLQDARAIAQGYRREGDELVRDAKLNGFGYVNRIEELSSDSGLLGKISDYAATHDLSRVSQALLKAELEDIRSELVGDTANHRLFSYFATEGDEYKNTSKRAEDVREIYTSSIASIDAVLDHDYAPGTTVEDPTPGWGVLNGFTQGLRKVAAVASTLLVGGIAYMMLPSSSYATAKEVEDTQPKQAVVEIDGMKYNAVLTPIPEFIEGKSMEIPLEEMVRENEENPIVPLDEPLPRSEPDPYKEISDTLDEHNDYDGSTDVVPVSDPLGTGVTPPGGKRYVPDSKTQNSESFSLEVYGAIPVYGNSFNTAVDFVDEDTPTLDVGKIKLKGHSIGIGAQIPFSVFGGSSNLYARLSYEQGSYDGEGVNPDHYGEPDSIRGLGTILLNQDVTSFGIGIGYKYDSSETPIGWLADRINLEIGVRQTDIDGTMTARNDLSGVVDGFGTVSFKSTAESQYDDSFVSPEASIRLEKDLGEDVTLFLGLGVKEGYDLSGSGKTIDRELRINGDLRTPTASTDDGRGDHTFSAEGDSVEVQAVGGLRVKF